MESGDGEMTMKPTNAEHEKFFQGIIKLLRETDLSPLEMLAVSSNLVGKLIAMMDQSKYTREQCMQIVTNNIELGNQQVIANLINKKPAGSA